MTVSVLAIAPALLSLKPSSKTTPPLKLIDPELLTWSWIDIAKLEAVQGVGAELVTRKRERVCLYTRHGPATNEEVRRSLSFII